MQEREERRLREIADAQAEPVDEALGQHAAKQQLLGEPGHQEGIGRHCQKQARQGLLGDRPLRALAGERVVAWDQGVTEDCDQRADRQERREQGET